MSMYLHHLRGCAPTPLAHYLKAIGILRVLAKQSDVEVRGFWRDGHFCLLTGHDEPALERFFLEKYSPTPVFNPWGARSGFFVGSNEATARQRLREIETSDAERLATYRSDIGIVRESLAMVGEKKPDGDLAKAFLVSTLRNLIRGPGAEWLDTVVAVVGESLKYPAIMGTGGNEGSGGYASAYYQSVLDCVLQEDHRSVCQRLRSSLFGAEEARPGDAWKETFGQFVPDGHGNPWDLLLAFEGAVAFRSSVTRRAMGAVNRRLLSSPFFLFYQALGTGSDASIDEYSVQKGRLNPGRGEQWFPIWERAATFGELKVTISEGRCSVGRNAAQRSLDAAQAIGQHGVARGIVRFVRYGYLQRNNLALHYAVPLGVIAVRERPGSRMIEDIRSWISRVRREARRKGAAARANFVERALSRAAFDAVDGDSPGAWQDLLIACASVELLHAHGTGFEAGPCPILSPRWLEAAADNSAEWRLAMSLGSAARGYADRRPFDSVRAHALPLDPRKPWRYAVGGDKRLVNDSRVVMSGRDALSDLIGLVERRQVEASQRGSRSLPLVAAPAAGARLDDLARFLNGEVDVERTVALGRALMALDWGKVRLTRSHGRAVSPRPDEAWEALRLCALPFPVRERIVSTDPAMFRRLASGEVPVAVELSVRRLRASGFRPPISSAIADWHTARRWAAAFAFPVERAVADAMAERFENPNTKENA